MEKPIIETPAPETSAAPITETDMSQSPEAITENPAPETMPEMGMGKRKIMDYMSKRKGQAIEQLSDDELEELGEMLSTDINQLEQQDEIFRTLYNTFEEFPEVKGFVSDLVKTGNLRLAVIRNFDTESLSLQEGDEDETEYKSAMDGRKKAKDEYEKSIAEVKSNMDASVKVVQDFVTRKKLDDVRAEEFMSKIDELLSDVARAKLTSDVLELFFKGFKYDEDMPEAEQRGKAEGRVEQIEPEMLEESKEILPDLGTSVGKKPSEKKSKSPFSSMAQEYRNEYGIK